MYSLLNQPLLYFNDSDAFTFGNGFEGIQILGGTGAGKTSGSGAAFALALLKAGAGGLVLCAKKDELQLWQHYARKTGRSSHILIIDGTGNFVFPFLQYEMSRKGEGAGSTDNLVRLFITVYEAVATSVQEGNDPYWTRAMQQLLRNAIDLCVIATGSVSIPLIYDVISSAPNSVEQIDSDDWKLKSKCAELFAEGYAKIDSFDKWHIQDFNSTANYWFSEYAAMGERTRSSIKSMLTSMLDIFLRRPFRMLFQKLRMILKELHIQNYHSVER